MNTHSCLPSHFFILTVFSKAVDKESKIDNFFGRVKAVLREAWTQRRLAWGEIERDLNAKLMAHQQQVSSVRMQV